jgi:polyisoprenoid-binding protein YceI
MERLIAATVLAAFCATPLPAQRPVPAGVVVSGTLSFDGRASLGDFSGITTTVTGMMTGGADLRTVRGWVEAPTITLKTGNGKRDRDMEASLEARRYPTIRFDLDSVSPHQEAGDSATVTLSGRLTIHGVTRDVAFPATIRFESGRLRLRSSVSLLLTDYQIGGLSKMFGLLRMYPDIVVRVELVFAAAAAARPEAAPGGTPPAS